MATIINSILNLCFTTVTQHSITLHFLVLFLNFLHLDCHCNPHGSLSQLCNKQNGQCTCRKNIVGRVCDRCAEGYWNLESGIGCQSCNCSSMGSMNLNCSAYTGQCNCKTGIGGLACDSCLEGYYGFSVNGCKRKLSMKKKTKHFFRYR